MTNQARSGPKVNVVHSTRVWLDQTVTWLYTLVSKQPAGIENHVICHRTKNEDQFPFANLVELGRDTLGWQLLTARSWRIRKWRKYKRLNALVSRTGARVLHSHFGNHAWENMAFADQAGLKHVVTFYGYDASSLPRRDPAWHDRYAELFDRAHLFLCEGPFFGERLIDLGCPREKVQVQHLGVQLDKIPFQARTWQAGEPLRVLLAGSFVEKKGLPYAVEALGRIKDRADLAITVIGDDNGQERSKKEKAEIMAGLARHGLESRTHLLGYQPYSVLLEEAQKNHLFISPSVTAGDGDSEGGAPVTIIEMSAAGMPVVSTVHCDIPEVVIDGKTGLLADERDIEGLTAKLNWLLDHPQEWPVMGTAARRHIEAEFAAQIQGERLAAHYRQLAAS